MPMGPPPKDTCPTCGQRTWGRLLTTGQVAELFNVTIATVQLWANRGRLPSFKTPNGHRRFRMDDILPYLDQLDP